MSGNVLEWTRSKYDREVDEDERSAAYLRGDAPRVVRGGAFLYNPRPLRAALRYDDHPAYRGGYVGFRVAAVPLRS